MESIRRIVLFLLIMWLIYLLGISAYVYQMVTVYDSNNTQPLPETLKDVQKLVKSLVEDEHNCYSQVDGYGLRIRS